MKIRNLVLVAGLATVLGGCVVAPDPYYSPARYDNPPPVGDDYYDDDYYDTPSYHGYYDVRVIFVGTIPYYVDDDRHIRPIPPEYRRYFERRQYMERNRRLSGPRFSRNDEVRDGYHTSRIVYLGDTPYYVDEGRGAQPLPRQLHERFRYTPLPPSRRPMERGPATRNDDGRVVRPDDNRGRNDAPVYNRDRDRNDAPVYNRDRDRNDAPAYNRDRERNDAPAFNPDRGRNDAPAFNPDRGRNDAPASNPDRGRNDAPAYTPDRGRSDAPVYGRGRQPSEAPTTNPGRSQMRNNVQERATSRQQERVNSDKSNGRGNPRGNGRDNQGNSDNQDNQNGNDNRRRDR